MYEFPPIPKILDNTIQICKTYEVEIEYEGERIGLAFNRIMDVKFDMETNEINIECTEEMVNNIY